MTSSKAPCKVVVLSGRGAAWSAGMDLKEYFRETDNESDAFKMRIREEAAAWQQIKLRYYAKPTIAMVNGWVFGGGRYDGPAQCLVLHDRRNL